MADTLTPEERSRQMARVRGKDSAPELALRRLIHGMGYRYRLHVRALPGTPDMVFRSRGAVVFMHGCFWHRHPGCARSRIPKSRVDFWTAKLDGNRRRDLRDQRKLRRMGWRVMVVWECQLSRPVAVAARVSRFLDGHK